MPSFKRPSLAFSTKFATRSAANSRLKNIFNVLYNLDRLTQLLVYLLMFKVRWTSAASKHLLTRILIIPIPSTVPNNVHLCRQPSWCDEIMHGQ